MFNCREGESGKTVHCRHPDQPRETPPVLDGGFGEEGFWTVTAAASVSWSGASASVGQLAAG